MRFTARPKAKVLLAALLLATGSIGLSAGLPAGAATLNFGVPFDAYTLDPHAIYNPTIFAIISNVYEPLVRRGGDLSLEPALATAWKQIDDTTWEFTLRQGVKFQDGGPFTADDVVFSFNRAKAGGLKVSMSTLASITKVSDFVVDIKTNGVDPIVPMEITDWFIMEKAWAEKNGAVQPGTADNKTETFANRNAMGTGPYEIAARDPGVKTEFVKNPGWWDKMPGNIDKATLFIIPTDATRVSALQSGQVDMIDSLPPQAAPRINATKGLHVVSGPYLRTVYLQPDVARDELLYSDVKGKNPFKDIRVRQAMQLSIDLDALNTKVMGGYTIPTGIPIGKGVNGWDADLAKPVAPDVEKAKALLAAAGYPNGFTVTLDCSNDRYVNDESTCIAISGFLGRVGIKIQPRIQTGAKIATQINPPGYNTSLTLLSYAPSTYDAHLAFASLIATRNPQSGAGAFNIGGYSDPAVDALIGKIQNDTDADDRRALIRQALALVKDSAAYIPIFQLEILWGVRDGVNVVQPADLSYPLRLFSVN